MQPESFLDVLIARFKDRWETNPQYRAAMSGVLGLVTLIVICTCTGIISTVAGNVLMAAGFGPTSNGTPQPGGPGGLVQGAAVFPISTPQLPTPINTPPANPAPLSQTPAPTPTTPPTPTPLPTATPCITNCGGGGGGGTSVTYIATWSPASWKSCTTSSLCSITIQASAPNVGVYFAFYACNGAQIFSSSAGQFVPSNGATDATGKVTYYFSAPGTPARTKADVTIQVQGAADQHIFPPCN